MSSAAAGHKTKGLPRRAVLFLSCARQNAVLTLPARVRAPICRIAIAVRTRIGPATNLTVPPPYSRRVRVAVVPRIAIALVAWRVRVSGRIGVAVVAIVVIPVGSRERTADGQARSSTNRWSDPAAAPVPTAPVASVATILHVLDSWGVRVMERQRIRERGRSC